jgi:hypothetical protein
VTVIADVSDAGGFALLGAFMLVAPALVFAAAVLLDHIVHGPNR